MNFLKSTINNIDIGIYSLILYMFSKTINKEIYG